MKQNLIIGVGLLFGVHLFAQNNAEQNASVICRLFKANKTDSITLFFTDEVKAQLSKENLTSVWNQLQNQVGELQSYQPPINRKEIGTNFYSSVFEFAKSKLELRMPFNENGLLMGLFFSTWQPTSNYKAPIYGKGKFIEENMTISSHGLKLKTILTKPEYTKKNVPLVVLVHGSGPHDADETIGNLKPFKDLAIGLAQNGIASLRYEKRTLNYKTDSLCNTPTKEVVLDALTMCEIVNGLADIDKKQIYLLGHSLGGLMAPKIVEHCPNVKGIILMAAPARPFEDIIWEQYNYILGLDSLDSDEKRKLADLKKQIDLIKSGNFDSSTPKNLFPLQIPAEYWQELATYKPLQSSVLQKKDILVLNGGKDYQVTQVDFDLWKTALAANKEAEFKFYPNLFHLFMPGNATPADYEQSGNVSEEVINDIVNFIK